MTVCPIALAVGCKRCAVFAVCPAKSWLGDAPAATPPSDVEPPVAATRRKAAKRKPAAKRSRR